MQPEFTGRERRADRASRDEHAPRGEEPFSDPAPRPGPSDEEEAFCAFLPDAYLRTDANGIIRKANPAAAALLRQPLRTLEGTSIIGCVTEERRATVRTLLDDLATERSARQQWPLPLQVADDRQVTVTATVAPIRDRTGTLTGLRWLLRPRPASESDDAVAAAGSHRHLPALEQVDRFAELLSRASGLMASSFDAAATLHGVAQLAVPTLGDWCLVDLLGADGRLRRLAAVHSIHEPADGDEMLAAEAPTLESVVNATGLLLGGASVHAAIVQPVPAEFLASVAANAAQLTQLTRLAPTAWLIVPLAARGQLFGVMTLIMAGSRRHYGTLTHMVAEGLAQRAALAADNARLYQLSIQAGEAKAAFLAAVSHELRTPLTAIMGYTELLRDGVAGEVPPEQRRMLDRVRESSDQLLTLVDEVLRYARLQAREEQAHLEPAELRDLLQAAAVLIEPLARRKGLTFDVHAPDDPVWLMTDAGKVRQILLNLLGNALKFTDEGGIALTGRVLPPERPGGTRHVRLEVRDSGIGIPPEQLAHIFDRFWQAERSATRRYGGTGLGLTVARELARLLGGDVMAESVRGQGSCFTVQLPLHDVLVLHQPQAAAAADAEAPR